VLWSRLANHLIHVLSKDEDRNWLQFADIMLLRIVLSMQHARQLEGARRQGGERGRIAQQRVAL
jgi:hypothetical protein